MKKIALTGGIASGKSTAAGILQKFGARIIDADRITHRLQAPHEPIWNAYVARYGQGILLADSEELNRPKIADIIYRDKQERLAVNAIAHPLVKRAMFAEAAALPADCPAAVFDIPLLFESGMAKDFAIVWLIYVPPEVQLARLMHRDGMTRETADRIIAAQMPAEEKLPGTDLVINNGVGRYMTRRQLIAAWHAFVIDA